MTDFGSFGNNVPVWDRYIAERLMPLARFFDALLIIIALACFFTIWAARRHPEVKALVIAFLLSP